jgi:hypothetical protein
LEAALAEQPAPDMAMKIKALVSQLAYVTVAPGDT